MLAGLLACAAFAAAQGGGGNPLDRKFQAAVAAYDAGKFPEAAAELEAILPQVPNSFEVRELLGLVYAAQSQNAKALKELQAAVRLKPDSAAARTNLAASLARSGQADLAEQQFRKALALEPRDFEANHDLGEFYIQSGKIAAAVPLLQQAQKIDATSYDNGYDLAQAYFLTGKLAEARESVRALVKEKDTGELHTLLGQIEEKDGNFVAAAREFEVAAHMDPSEENLFAWGSELLLHWTYEPAVAVFQQGAQRYPQSPRLAIGLGVALYSTGKYDEALKSLLAASDLSPADPGCYLFLFKVYDHFPRQADEVIARFRRFAELQPGNAMAQYYYAMSLWKGKSAEDSGLDLHQVEALLQKSIALDDKVAETHFELGNLYADQNDYDKSVPQYERALQLNPDIPTAHFRLGRYYARIGQKDRSQQEIATYQRLRAQNLADGDKQAAEIQKFVYSEKGASTATK